MADNPRPPERFFEVHVVGSNHTIEQLYPGNDPNIAANVTVQWYVGVTNRMASLQFVTLRFKLGNASIPAPDDASGNPSPAPLLVEYSRVILRNETWETPFAWQVVEESISGDAVSLTIDVNGTKITMPDPANPDGENFRLIIELWVYNPNSGSLEFGWLRQSERRIAWLQIWFNVITAP